MTSVSQVFTARSLLSMSREPLTASEVHARLIGIEMQLKRALASIALLRQDLREDSNDTPTASNT